MSEYAPPSELEHFIESPRESLKPFVNRLLRTRSRCSSLAHRVQVPPSGCQYLTFVDGAPLFFYFDDEAIGYAPPLFIGGQLKNRAPVCVVRGEASFLGVEFRPCGFHRLFRCACSPLADSITSLEQLAGEDAAALHQRLKEAESDRQKFDALQDFLEPLAAKALPEGPADRAVAFIYEAAGRITVDALARELGMSTRQLNRYFLRAVGVSPKHFAKVVQIRAVVETLHRNEPDEITDLAYRAGYYDQSHFIHDFQRLVGKSPVSFLRGNDPFLTTYLINAK